VLRSKGKCCKLQTTSEASICCHVCGSLSICHMRFIVNLSHAFHCQSVTCLPHLFHVHMHAHCLLCDRLTSKPLLPTLFCLLTPTTPFLQLIPSLQQTSRRHLLTMARTKATARAQFQQAPRKKPSKSKITGASSRDT
jgi:hypothetical protein